jgi:hypothetical protein
MGLMPVLDGLEGFARGLDRTLAIGMRTVRDDQMRPVGEVEVKDDLSLRLRTDKDVEEQLREWARQLGLPFYGEEFGAQKGTNTRYLFVADPVDGSRPLANRDAGGSTIILYLYDTVERRIVATIIARPGTGEVWVATNDVTERFLYSYETGRFSFLHECHVWQFNPKVSRPTVYVDNLNPFPRRGLDMLRAAGLNVLDAELRNLGVTKFAVGSNGLHHCLVATGGPVVGSITTSIGGVQDLGGIKVVENARGCVAAFRLSDDRKLVEVDAHADIFMNGGEGYDFLVTAIDARWLENLITVLQRSL